MNSHIYVIFRNFVTNVFFVNIYVIMKQNNIYIEYYPFILKIWQVVSRCFMQHLWPLDLRPCLMQFHGHYTCMWFCCRFRSCSFFVTLYHNWWKLQVFKMATWTLKKAVEDKQKWHTVLAVLDRHFFEHFAIY